MVLVNFKNHGQKGLQLLNIGSQCVGKGCIMHFMLHYRRFILEKTTFSTMFQTLTFLTGEESNECSRVSWSELVTI